MTANPQQRQYNRMTPNGPGMDAGILHENGGDYPMVRHWRPDMTHIKYGKCLASKAYIGSGKWESALWVYYPPEEVKPL